MLIVPLSGKITWRNPPWITIGLILINCFVFLVFQTKEDTRYQEAMTFYFESDLAQIEISRYLAYLETKTGDKGITALRNRQKLDQETLRQFYRRMQRDRDFVHRLYSGEIIPPYEDLHETWKDLRKEYEDRLSRVTSYQYGFVPARMRAVSAFTHMFLHGGFMHLLGNMIFLWLVGCVLETGWGRVMYSVTYVVTGLLAVGLYALVNRESLIPLVGASGAISGLIGAYTVSYGKSRIKVFYSLGFYFDYVRVHAILLLPAWIAMELFQLFFGSETGVAYMAHVGGLASGALIAFLNLRVLGKVDTEVFAEDPKERLQALQQQALSLMERLDMNGAREVSKQILEIDPDNRSALLRLYQIEKLQPEGQPFREAAARLLRHMSSGKTDGEELYKTYKDYFQTSANPRIRLELLLRIGNAFGLCGHLEESEKIMALALKKAPRADQLPSSLLALARSYMERGMREKGRQWLQVVSTRFPESNEARIAQGLLKSSGRR